MADGSMFDIADVHSEFGDGESLTSKAADWVTKGVPVALASGVTSILNTGISLGNIFGDYEKINTEDQIRKYDDNLAEYYAAHKEGADVGGFVLTSMIPGTLGIKGLKALQGIQEGGAIGKATASITGYAASAEQAAIRAAAETVAGPKNLIWSDLTAQKLKAIAWGAGDQALQGLAFEAGVLLTMNQNPVINPDDRGYFGSILHNIPQSLENAAIFGGVGGVLNAAKVTGDIKLMKSRADAQYFPSLNEAILADTSLTAGTKAAYVFDQLEQRDKIYRAMLNEATIDEKFLKGYEKTTAAHRASLDRFITERFAGGDAELAAQVRGALRDLQPVTENGFEITRSELAARVLGASKSAQRIGDVDQIANLAPEFHQFHGTPEPVAKFKNDERGSVYNIIGPGLYTTDAYQIASQYANRPGATKPTIYGFKEKPGVNLPLYDINQPITPEIRSVILRTDPAFAAFGELDRAATLQDFYLTAARKSFGEGHLPASQVSDSFQAIRDYFEGLGYRGLTHTGGILGGPQHKVKIYWYPENDLIRNNSPISAAMASEGGQFLLHVAPNPRQRIVKLSGDRKGGIVSQAYPAPGDTGSVVWNADKQHIRVDGIPRNLNLEYKPLENSPTTSSFQFLHAKLSDKLPEGDVIPYGNLPLMEKALMENMGGKVKIEGLPGHIDEADLAEALRAAKLDAMQDLVNAGKGEDYISRAINAPMEFVEKGTGPTSLYQIGEDHTKPLFAKLGYTGIEAMNKFAQEGMLHVYENAKIAKTKLTSSAANTLGEYFTLFEPSGPLVNVNTIPDVTNLIKAAEAPYGSSASKYLHDGKMEQQIVDKISAARSDALHGAQVAIESSPATLAEFNVVITKMRSSDSGWVKMPDDVYHDAENFILVQRKVLNEALSNKEDPIGALAELTNAAAKDSKVVIKLKNDSPIVEYLENHHAIVSSRAGKFNVMNAAKGSPRRLPTDEYYVPPIDTTRQQHFVLVRENNPLDPERGFTTVVAPNAEALEAKIAAIRTEFGDRLQILSPKDIENKKIIDGVYESGDFFQKTAVDSALKKNGILADFAPRTDNYIFSEFDNWHYRNEHAMIRQSIEALRADEFAQLRFMADNYGELYAAKFGGKSLKPSENPYLQLINTSLNISNKSYYDKYWGSINRGASAAYNKISTVWQEMHLKAEAGEISVEEANRIATSHGWRAPYGDVARDVWNPVIPDPNALTKLVSKANLAISTLMLRMDALNAVVNTISLPILMQAELTSIKRNLSDPTIVGKLSTLLSEAVPGTKHRIPSAASLLFDGTGAYIKNPEVGIPGINQRMHEYFVAIGAIKTEPQLLRAAMDAVPIGPDGAASQKGAIAYVANLTKRVGELGAKYTGNNLAEDFVRFQAAHAMLRVASEAGITNPAELAGYINTFVNRVHGNYLSSQRPSLFQGPIGQAIGLFQTYQFNMIQQMTRYLQQGDRSAVVAAAALQNTIFGLQGNPLFYQLNNYIGNSNRENRDIVSTVGATIGSPDLKAADPARWLMYGLGANALQVNLYSRGDLTPRYATVVPDRLQDIPIVSIPTKAIGSFLDSMNMLAKGAGVPESILHGVAHSGFNRPLAGLAALAQGGRTTSQGTLLAAYNDIDGWLVAATLAGGRPLNEAVLTDQYYRNQAYAAADSKRIAEVAEAVKLTAGGQRGILDPDQAAKFLQEYAAAGGNQTRANQFLIRATRDSQQSAIDRMKSSYHSPFGKRMRDMMGNAPDTPEDSLSRNTAQPQE